MFIQIEYMSLFKDKKLSTRISLTSFTTFLTCFNCLYKGVNTKSTKQRYTCIITLATDYGNHHDTYTWIHLLAPPYPWSLCQCY